MAVLPIANYPVHNTDGMSFRTVEGLNEIKLDFKKKGFTQQGKFTAMEVSQMERGNFYYVTHVHALWVLKKFVDVPGGWGKGKNSHLTENTPVIKFFNDGKEEYTITYGQIGFKNQKKEAGTQWGDFSEWYAKIEVHIPQIGGRTNASAFVPRIRLWDLNDGSAVEIHMMLGTVKPLDKEKYEKEHAEITKPQQPTTGLPPDYNEKMAKYTQAIQDIQVWYQDEVRKLNAKAKDMPDKELNQAMEKLTADYNRKHLAALSAMPTIQWASPKANPSSGKAEDPQDKTVGKKEVAISIAGQTLQFQVPKEYVVRKTVQESEFEFLVWLWPSKTPLTTMLDVAPTMKVTIHFSPLAGDSPKVLKTLKGDGFNVELTGKDSFDLRYKVKTNRNVFYRFKVNYAEIPGEKFAEALVKSVQLIESIKN